VRARTQRKPETVTQLAAWQRRMRAFLAAGVGGPDCETGTDHVQAAYATGEQYGPPNPPCSACGALMASWETRPVGDTGYHRLPGRDPEAPARRPQANPGVSVPEQRVAGADTASGVTV
jgi:hypothetical protein